MLRRITKQNTKIFASNIIEGQRVSFAINGSMKMVGAALQQLSKLLRQAILFHFDLSCFKKAFQKRSFSLKIKEPY